MTALSVEEYIPYARNLWAHYRGRWNYDPDDLLAAAYLGLMKAWHAWDARRAFRHLRDQILLSVPDCRERSIALTHLQTAMMFTVAAMVLNDPESAEPDVRRLTVIGCRRR